MPETYFDSLGFFSELDDNLHALDENRIIPLGFENDYGYDHVSTYADPSGANLVLFTTDDGDSNINVSVTGKAPTRVEATQLRPGYVRLTLLDADGSGIPILVDVDDPHIYTAQDEDNDTPLTFETYHVGAVADDITVYPSQQAYYDSQEGFDVSNSPLQDEIPNLGNELKFAAESIVCPWLFELAFNSESIDLSWVICFSALPFPPKTL